jgi:hypothetical protein
MEFFNNPEIYPVVARNAKDQNDSLPAYVATPVSLVSYLKDMDGVDTDEEQPCIKIIDFGNCELVLF